LFCVAEARQCAAGRNCFGAWRIRRCGDCRTPARQDDGINRDGHGRHTGRPRTRQTPGRCLRHGSPPAQLPRPAP